MQRFPWIAAAGMLMVIGSGCATLSGSGTSAQGVCNVRRFGARGDGVHDDTEAFRRTIETAQPHNGVVLVPPGSYRLTGTLALEGVALQGIRPSGFPADMDPMASLEIDHAAGPAVVASHGATLDSLLIRYPAREDLERPPAVLLTGIGVTIARLKIARAWEGIMADGTSNVGRVNIRDVFMPDCYGTGLYLTRTLDVANLDNIEVWSPDPRAMDGGAVAFRFGRNDELRALNLFAFATETGFLFDLDDAEDGGWTYGEFANCCTDFCPIGVRIVGPARIGFVGGTFLNHHQSFLVENERADLRVVGADMQSNGAAAVELTSAGRVILSGCTIRRAVGAFEVPKILADSVRSLVVTSCVFDPAGPGIRFGAGVKRAVVRGNIFEAEEWPALIGAEDHPGDLRVDGNVFRVPEEEDVEEPGQAELPPAEEEIPGAAAPADPPKTLEGP